MEKAKIKLELTGAQANLLTEVLPVIVRMFTSQKERYEQFGQKEDARYKGEEAEKVDEINNLVIDAITNS